MLPETSGVTHLDGSDFVEWQQLHLPGFTAKISLASDQQRIDIGIYNMLGKRMGDVYAGPATKGDHEYTISTDDLPEGVYICILQGGDFRRAAKFYLNR